MLYTTALSCSLGAFEWRKEEACQINKQIGRIYQNTCADVEYANMEILSARFVMLLPVFRIVCISSMAMERGGTD